MIKPIEQVDNKSLEKDEDVLFRKLVSVINIFNHSFNDT